MHQIPWASMRVRSTRALVISPVVSIIHASVSRVAVPPITVDLSKVLGPWPAVGDFHLDAGAANQAAIQSLDGVFGVIRITEFDEGESGRISGHENTSEATVALERLLNLVFGCVLSQASYIDLAACAGRVSTRESRHFVVKSNNLFENFLLIFS